MSRTSYYKDSIGNQDIFRCLHCQYDTFSESSVIDHHRFNHLNWELPETAMPLREWHEWRRIDNGLQKSKIAIGLLTWNTSEASRLAARAIAEEVFRLTEFKIDSHVFWADNGSDDGTVDAVMSELSDVPVTRNLLEQNWGQSIARNWICDGAVSWNCDYLAMVDGDVEVIPYSVFAMTDYLMRQEIPGVTSSIGCIGMYCRNCTHLENDGASTDCRRIDEHMVSFDPPIAWTNYGVFRCSVIDACRFDVAGPFQGPGWGFEDDDYYLTMMSKGYDSVNTKYFRHMHRRRHSSLKNMDPNLAAKVYNERKAYLLDKWSGRSLMPSVRARLDQIANMTPPMLEY